MIVFLRGVVAHLEPAFVELDCKGVGYRVLISLTTYGQLKAREREHPTEALHLLTHFQVKETEHVLYGFTEAAERAWFLQLLAVSGVGGSTALAILSGLTPQELASAIAEQDVKRLQQVKGIGGKTASRIILELQGKLPTLAPEATGAAPLPAAHTEALEALVALGLNRAAMEKRLTELRQAQPTLDTEGLIKAALRNR